MDRRDGPRLNGLCGDGGAAAALCSSAPCGTAERHAARGHVRLIVGVRTIRLCFAAVPRRLTRFPCLLFFGGGLCTPIVACGPTAVLAFFVWSDFFNGAWLLPTTPTIRDVGLQASPPMQKCARVRAEPVRHQTGHDGSFGHQWFGAPTTAWRLRCGAEATDATPDARARSPMGLRRRLVDREFRCASVRVTTEDAGATHRCSHRHAVCDRAGAASAWPKRPPTNAETLPRGTGWPAHKTKRRCATGGAVLLQPWAHVSPFSQEILVRRHVAAQDLVFYSTNIFCMQQQFLGVKSVPICCLRAPSF